MDLTYAAALFLTAIVVWVGISVLLVLAALRMRRLDCYGMAVSASIVAMLPIHPGFVIGLPIGIWSLVVLMRPEVKAAFTSRSYQGLADSEDSWKGQDPFRWVSLLASSLFAILLLAGVAGYLTLRQSSLTLLVYEAEWDDSQDVSSQIPSLVKTVERRLWFPALGSTGEVKRRTNELITVELPGLTMASPIVRAVQRRLAMHGTFQLRACVSPDDQEIVPVALASDSDDVLLDDRLVAQWVAVAESSERLVRVNRHLITRVSQKEAEPSTLQVLVVADPLDLDESAIDEADVDIVENSPVLKIVWKQGDSQLKWRRFQKDYVNTSTAVLGIVLDGSLHCAKEIHQQDFDEVRLKLNTSRESLNDWAEVLESGVLPAGLTLIATEIRGNAI